jgi:hypothetical protein
MMKTDGQTKWTYGRSFYLKTPVLTILIKHHLSKLKLEFYTIKDFVTVEMGNCWNLELFDNFESP